MKLPFRRWLTDASWQKIAPKIPDLRRCWGTQDVATRRFLEGVLWIWRTGAPWRDLPTAFGKWATVYRRFRRWAVANVWQAVHARLVACLPANSTKVVSLDSTSVRVHQHGACARQSLDDNAVGRSRGGRTTKVHTVVAGDKTLVAYKVTPGQHADIRYAGSLMEQVHGAQQVLADRAYDADAWLAWLKARGIEGVVPSRRHRKHQRPLAREAYAGRNQVERFYAHLKQYRRVATRYDKTCASYTAGLLLVCATYAV